MAKLDPVAVRAMIHDRKTAGEICAAFGVTNSTLTKFRHDHEIPVPIRTYRGRPADPLPVAPQKPVSIGTEVDPRTAGLVATGGRYAGLRDWAEAWGVTATRALAEWHRLPRQVKKGCST